MRMGLIAGALLALASFAAAGNTGEMWEVSSQMNIPGMPAGMGAQTRRVCQGDDPERSAAQSKDRQSCKLKDRKQTATRLTVTMVCAEGTMTIDQQYNAAHTEFKGTMKMASKDGDFTMNMTGRKVGTCDVQEARRERDEKVAAMKKQSDANIAQMREQQKGANERQLKECAAAVETMQHRQLGIYGQCYRKTDATCKGQMDALSQMGPDVVKGCTARTAEYCRRYQTQEGFLKARADKDAAAMCGVSVASIKAAQCPRAAKSESLAFLGAYCPAEAKPIAQVQCVGRDYTSKLGGKYAAFCQNYLANADFEKEEGASRSAPAASPAAPAQPAPAQPADQVKEGINQGLDKLKGLFGR